MRRAMICVAMAALALAACSSSKKSSSSSSAAAAATTTTAAAAQTVTITPDSGLKDGQVVKVVGKGYTAGKQFGVTECADKGNATGAGDCNLRGIKVAVADSTGTVTIDYPVAKGPFGSNNIVCSSSQACLVSVADAGSANPTEVATTHITFAP